MKRPFKQILLILLCFITFTYNGCHTEPAKDSIPDWIQCLSFWNDTIYWLEVEDQFYTTDLARAQDKVPFPIVLPSYIPDKGKGIPLPSIKGPLIDSNMHTGLDNKIEININYSIDLSEEAGYLIRITECNYPYTIGDPKWDSDLESIEIEGKQVVRAEFDHSLGPAIWFSFRSQNIYFVVESYNIPADEAMKIVESIIGQIE
ncbi:MAG: hypothetical protein JSV54_06185 [Chloroflexota bacterium]|nr:MAG: hypothetical protein JSV54_06185 [Chloroflexota bacterium]